MAAFFGRPLRNAPLALATLAALVPPELDAEITIYNEGVEDVDFQGIESVSPESPSTGWFTIYLKAITDIGDVMNSCIYSHPLHAKKGSNPTLVSVDAEIVERRWPNGCKATLRAGRWQGTYFRKCVLPRVISFQVVSIASLPPPSNTEWFALI
jgi:hypothetical protein